MKNKNGLSLIELIVVLLIASIILMFSIPSFRNLLLQSRASTKANQIVSVLHLGRIEAINRGKPIIFCHSKDQMHCDGQWSDGQILFVDDNLNGRVSDKKQLLRILPPLKKGEKLEWCGFLAQDRVKIFPNGASQAMSGHFLFHPAANTLKYDKRIILSQTGRVRVSYTHRT